jgi:hypothetical protein
MQKSITALLALVLTSAAPAAFAQSDLQVKEGAPDRYVVQKGDTLWGIATKFLKDQWRWPEIWRMNQDQIRNPHRISPGDVLVLDRSVSPPQLRMSETGSGGGSPAVVSNDTLKLSPRVYSEALAAEAIPTIPPKAIEPFLTQPLVIEEGGLDKAPRVIATEENRYNVGAGNVAYVTGIGNSTTSIWQFYRPGQPLIDPDSQKTLGVEAVFLGTAKVARNGDPATVQILNSKMEVSAGDRLIPAPPPAIPLYVPHAPSTQIAGRIIGLYDALSTSSGGRDSVISLNRGKRDGLEPGHVLAIYCDVAVFDQQDYLKSRENVPLIQLPPERYGLVFVFRTFDAVSYGLVMESSRPVEPGDLVRTP